MNLHDISKQLLTTQEKLGETLAQLFKLEVEYTTKYNQLLLHSNMGTQALKTAEVEEMMKQDPIYVPYQEKRLEVKILYSKLDTLREISRNMRNLAFNE